MIMNGAQIVIDALKKEGVDTVFGYPGGQALPLYDALYDAGLNHILTRHEQGAVHAADGYARASGKVGVCISTSGPGATNLITGIATAHMDSVPMVCITCQVGLSALGKDSFQEADITGITTPITKHNFMVRHIDQLARIMRKAFYIARTGRPGPVVVDIPKDICTQETELVYPDEITLPGYHPKDEGNDKQLSDILEQLARAKRPVLFVGGGAIIAEASPLVRALVDKLDIPVVESLMGISCLPSDHPRNLGLVGMHGHYAANMAVMESDFLLACGVRFSDRVIGLANRFAPDAKIAQLDIDPAEINKNIKVDYRLVGNLNWSLPLLLKDASCGDLSAWHKTIACWQEDHPLHYAPGASGKLMPQEVLEALDSLLGGEAIIVTDVGQHQMWSAQYMHFNHPRSFLSSGGLGTMGYGLPAAIGAQIAKPEREVWLISGDGSIMMNCQEMATAAELGIPIRVLILNNRGLGMVRQWQRRFYGHRYSYSKHELDQDFALLAEAMHCTGMRLEAGQDVLAELTKARQTPGPIIIDARVDDDEDVIPMVAPGRPIDEMMEC